MCWHPVGRPFLVTLADSGICGARWEQLGKDFDSSGSATNVTKDKIVENEKRKVRDKHNEAPLET